MPTAILMRPHYVTIQNDMRCKVAYILSVPRHSESNRSDAIAPVDTRTAAGGVLGRRRPARRSQSGAGKGARGAVGIDLFVCPFVHDVLSGYSSSGRRRRRPCCSVYAPRVYLFHSRDHARRS